MALQRLSSPWIDKALPAITAHAKEAFDVDVKRTPDDAISLRGSNVPAMIDTLNEFFTTPGNIDYGEMISAVGRGIVSLICERLRLRQGREETGAHQLPGDAGSAFWHPRVRD